jgi:hypothetical protein
VSESEASVPGGQESSRDKKQLKKKKKKKSDANKKGSKEEEERHGFDSVVSESNILFQMESKVKLEPQFMANYEQWLEDEVWSYFD